MATFANGKIIVDDVTGDVTIAHGKCRIKITQDEIYLRNATGADYPEAEIPLSAFVRSYLGMSRNEQGE